MWPRYSPPSGAIGCSEPCIPSAPVCFHCSWHFSHLFWTSALPLWVLSLLYLQRDKQEVFLTHVHLGVTDWKTSYRITSYNTIKLYEWRLLLLVSVMPVYLQGPNFFFGLFFFCFQILLQSIRLLLSMISLVSIFTLFCNFSTLSYLAYMRLLKIDETKFASLSHDPSLSLNASWG